MAGRTTLYAARSSPGMTSPFDRSEIRNGMGVGSALIIAFVAFTFFEGTTRWLLLGVAVVELVVVPRVLKQA